MGGRKGKMRRDRSGRQQTICVRLDKNTEGEEECMQEGTNKQRWHVPIEWMLCSVFLGHLFKQAPPHCCQYCRAHCRLTAKCNPRRVTPSITPSVLSSACFSPPLPSHLQLLARAKEETFIHGQMKRPFLIK